MRRLVHHVLASAFQAEVCEVDDGLGALEHLHHETFDLVILDIHMNVMDGIETVQAIRRSSVLRTLPVVMISGAADKARVRQLIGLNVSEIIAKPFTPSSLEKRLAPLMTRLQTGGPSAAAPARPRLNLRPS